MRVALFIFMTVYVAMHAVAESAPRTLAPHATEAFHIERQAQQQLWSDVNYDGLIEAIKGMEAHGLTPEHYHLTELIYLRGNPAARDKVATDAWMSAAAHLLYGKLDPVTIDPDWTAGSREANLAAVLDYALLSNTIETSLDQMAPLQPEYAVLRAELASMFVQAATPLAKISAGSALKAGDKGERVRALQARLQNLGFLAAPFEAETMDAPTLAAVEAFQVTEGLAADSIAGAATLTALNRGPEERIDQLRVNLERWRWLPADLGVRHVRANIASFKLTAFEQGAPQQSHLVIVGKPFRKTPVFSDQIEYIVFNPWWELPGSLARADKLPLFQRDPSAVKRLGFQVINASGEVVNPATIDWNSYSASNFPFRLRQAPGPMNALGKVKIIFPNAHSVYIHDTPTRTLFDEPQRAFSSGCLRTQDPITLSEWLLKYTDGWSRERIDAAVATGDETRVNLSEKVPVHILYFTIEQDGVGNIRYLDDIYQRDQRVLSGLNEAPP